MTDNQDIKPSSPVNAESDGSRVSDSEEKNKDNNFKKYLSLGWEFFKIIVFGWGKLFTTQ